MKDSDSKTFFDLMKPPFKAVLSNGLIVDQNDKYLARAACLFSTHFEGELTDEFHHWIVDAMNEKWKQEKPHDPEEPVKCISCKHICEWQLGYFRCKKRDISVDPYTSEPCKAYRKGDK